jgi:hypothetical protein
MNKTLFICLSALVLSFANVTSASAQSNKSIFDSWPELKTFHGVMSQTFHPMEAGDLAPIRSRSGEMHSQATALAKAAIPAEYNTPPIKAAVQQLRTDSKALHKLIKKQGSDAAVVQSLTALHDIFHEIVGLCKDEHP